VYENARDLWPLALAVSIPGGADSGSHQASVPLCPVLVFAPIDDEDPIYREPLNIFDY
jgi:hypothetical protein